MAFYNLNYDAIWTILLCCEDTSLFYIAFSYRHLVNHLYINFVVCDTVKFSSEMFFCLNFILYIIAYMIINNLILPILRNNAGLLSKQTNIVSHLI